MEESNILNPKLTVLLFSVLVHLLGGKVRITQQDIDIVAYNRLEEEVLEDGSLQFKLITKKLNA